MKLSHTLLAIILSTVSLGAFAQTIKIDTEKSTITWTGKKIGGQHTGFIKFKNGSLELSDGHIIGGTLIVDMATITNTDLTNTEYNKKLVNHLMSEDFFGVQRFPTASITLSNVSSFKNGKASARGKITIKENTEDISFDIYKEGNSYTTNVDIDRSRYSVRYGSPSFFNNLGDKAIDDIFNLKVVIVTNKKFL